MSNPLLPTTTMSTDELREYERTHGKLKPAAARERVMYRRDQMQARVLADPARAHLIYDAAAETDPYRTRNHDTGGFDRSES